MTTKLCPYCEHDVVVPLRSLNSKICNGCKQEFPWTLDPGQKPLLAPSRADRRAPEGDSAIGQAAGLAAEAMAALVQEVVEEHLA